jgi:hypothetical protein
MGLRMGGVRFGARAGEGWKLESCCHLEEELPERAGVRVELGMIAEL